MARVVISEFGAKKLLLGDSYKGVSIDSETDLSTLKFEDSFYVVKVDDGTKKRNKRGMVNLNIPKNQLQNEIQKFLKEGHKRIIVEPYVPHQEFDEKYISATVVREGVKVLYSELGGNEVEKTSHKVNTHLISRSDFFSDKQLAVEGVPAEILVLLLQLIRNNAASFVEVNPFIVGKDNKIHLLDLAVELDSSKKHLWADWVAEQVQTEIVPNDYENLINQLNKRSTATFSIKVFDEDASIFTTLSGGGASLVVLDSLVQVGLQDRVANYSEYSGGPNRAETAVYTEQLVKLLLASTASKKVLVIAGGVANFTDITDTLFGIVDGLEPYITQLKSQNVMVRVRRGGPRQQEGLNHIKKFLDAHNIDNIVTDASDGLSQVADDVAKYLS